MDKKTQRKDSKYKRKIRSRLKVKDNFSRPRLCVFRSAKYIYGQIIDNTTGKTLLGVSSKDIDSKKDDKGKIDISFRTGEELAKKALKKKIDQIVFDRSGYKYHGRVKALAEGARKGGLKF
jgi:large subunit ribosomal protein L18